MATGGIVFSASTWNQPMPELGGPERLRMVDRLVAMIEDLGQGRLRVAIDGRTAAGKTSLGHEVARQLAEQGRTAFRASLDDFKRPWSESDRYDRVSGEGYYRNAFDLRAVRHLLLDPAAADGDGTVALCSIDPLTQVDHSATRATMPRDGVLVVDGVFACRPELNGCWDLRIWVDIAPELSVARGTSRDADAEGGRAAAEALHRDRYLAAEELYVREVEPIAFVEVVVDNTDLDRPRLVRPSATGSARVSEGRVTSAPSGLLVVGAGFGRTGTLSLKRALDELGFGPTYHMEEMFKHPSHVARWREFAATGSMSWDRLFASYRSGVDFPVSCAWRELADAYPDAKVVLTVRDPQRWWESTAATIFGARDMFPPWLRRLVPLTGAFLAMNEELIWDGIFDGRFPDRRHAVGVFERHIAEVQATVPVDRLLTFAVADGWGPLCEFLGVPEPVTPFPHANDTVRMRRRVAVARIGTRLLPVGALAVVALAARAAVSRRGRGARRGGRAASATSAGSRRRRRRSRASRARRPAGS
jgi:uridine kinase